MKKYWTSLVVLILLSALVSLKHERYANNSGKYGLQDNFMVAANNTPNGKSNPLESEDKAEKWWERGYLFFGWPNGITIWALILTMIAIAEQTSATKDTTNLAYGSLSFTEAQFEMMREKERARLDLNVERTNLEVEVAGEHLLHLIATVSVRNIGASKAFIGRTSGTLITKLRNDPLGDVDYSPLDLPEQCIPPDQPFVPVKVYCFPTSTTTTFAECLEEGTFTLHFFGFIEYETLGLWWRKEFGYDWKIVDRDSSLGGLYGLSDPYPNSPRPARDRITYGYWHPNEERDKPEYSVSGEPTRSVH